MLGLINNLLAKNAISFTDNYSVAFDGTGDYIDTGATFQATFRDSFTISFWVKLPDGQPSSAFKLFGSLSSNAENYLQVEVQATGKIGVWFEANNDSSYGTTTGPIFTDGANDWKFITLTVANSSGSSSTLVLYANATVITPSLSATITEENQAAFTTDANIVIGAENDAHPSSGGVKNFMTGNIDDFAIWSAALDADAVTAIYNSGTPIDLTINSGNYDNSSNLVGYWKFEENTGTTAYDSAGINHGTLSGDPQWDNDAP